MTKERRPKELLNEVYYAPVPGRVVIFPSWLKHEGTIKRKVFDKRKGHDSKGVLTTDGERVKNS